MDNINDYINSEMESFNKAHQEESHDDTLDFDYQPASDNESIIKVIGVGGGGMNAVAHMFNEGIKDVSFLVINTDKQALSHSPITNRLQIGPGLGAGAKPEKAQQYAEENKDKIASLLKDGTEMVFITAGMGGGTGTGAGPVVAAVAQEMGLLTVGIVTIPFKFEGIDKIKMALDGVEEMRKHVDALLVVNNDRLIDIYPDLDFSNAFAKADDTLAIAAKSISDIINRPGYVNLDFADVTTTLKDSGVALISTGEAEGEGRVSEAIRQAVASPLLLDNDISRAKHLLFEICFSHEHPVTMKEINELNAFIRNINPAIKVIWGAMFDDDLGEKVRMIILSSGFDVESVVPGGVEKPKPQNEKPGNVAALAAQQAAEEARAAAAAEEERKRKEAEAEAERRRMEEEKRRQDEEERAELQRQIAELQAQLARKNELQQNDAPHWDTEEAPQQSEPAPQPEATQQPEPAPQPQQPEAPAAQDVRAEEPQSPLPSSSAPAFTPAASTVDAVERIRRYYGDKTADDLRAETQRQNYVVLDQDDLTNEELISLLEKLPAYNRTSDDLGQIQMARQNRAIDKPQAPQSSEGETLFK